jgi:putative ABC transport system ATP-binding protein
MNFLSATNLKKRYGEGPAAFEALRGVSFEASAGEFIALMGPSGCGKSTLLHLIGAMDRPTDGEVTVNGRRFDQLSVDQLALVRRRHVGFVFQTFNLLPTLSAQENVGLPLALDGVSEQQCRQQSTQALEQVGMEGRAGHYPSQLSGGEMQRVAIARAIVVRPDLLAADEPTGSLDSVNGQRVLQLLRALNETLGLTIVMATHSNEAAAYASRTLSLRDGRLERVGDSNVVSSPL